MKPRTILLVEEDHELRRLLRDQLEKLGYWVVAAPGAERPPGLLQMIDSVDLLVVDVTVPDSDSIALTEELLGRRGDLSTVLISTDDTEFEVRQRFQAGRTRFLLKPFSIPELRECVSQALRPRWVGALLDAGKRFRPSENRVETTGFRRFSTTWGLAAAAAMVLVAGVLLHDPKTAPPLPYAVDDAVLRGETVKVLEPKGDHPVMPEWLRWEEHADAVSYRIRILAVDDTVLWEGESPVGAVRLTPEVLAALHPGVVYFWTVEALDARGDVRVRSETARFQVVPLRGD